MSDLLRERNVSLVLADCSIFGFVLGLALLVVPLYTLTLSNSPLVLAAVVAVFPLTAVLLSLASGAISEAFGSRSMLIGAFALLARLAPPGRQYAVQGLGASTQQVGTIVGPFVGGWVSGVAGFPMAFLVGAVLALVGLVVGLAMKHDGQVGDGWSGIGAFLLRYHRQALGALLKNQAVLWANLVHAATLVSWPVMRSSFYLAYLTL